MLLQVTELTQATQAAAAAATAQVSQQGPLFAVLWALVLLLVAVCLGFYLKAEKAVREHQEACTAAVAAARVEWAKQQALDNGHAADMLRQSREQEREALDRLDLINRELRQQEVKSVEVIGGVRTALSQLSTIMHTVQTQLQVIEALLTGRRSQPPAPPSPTATSLL
ncbi:MAG: hypothetical protein JWP58_2751 [Hymenobacter sp.]|nr:hypothetical protein [Hymenobacter sp.]